MGYYCTVPQCTSLAGKTKNVKFHRFPRDVVMADKWNVILKRGKPYTKYSKVCSLHFTQSDYNVTNMGQWKTLSKDAVPSQNLPRLNPDGSVMVIRKSRTLKYKDGKKDDSPVEKTDKWSSLSVLTHSAPEPVPEPDKGLAYRLQTLHAIASGVATPQKQDAFMQTEPLQSEEDEAAPPTNSYSETSDNSFHSEQLEYPAAFKDEDKYSAKRFSPPGDYTKPADDYMPQTNEEYNKEAEKYALGRKSLSAFEKPPEAQFAKPPDYQKLDMYAFDKQDFRAYPYTNGYTDSAEILRNQQHNLQILQQQRASETHTLFADHIKQELERDDDKLTYDTASDQPDASLYAEPARRLTQAVPPQVKQEPEGCEGALQQDSPYYSAAHDAPGYYEPLARPGPELLIAKQNALAAHTQLWQNTMKRPFFYSESAHYSTPPLLHRYEDIPRILQ